MRGRNTGKGVVVDLDAIRVRALLADLRGSDPDPSTRRRLDVELRGLARKHPRFASSIYATARALRAPCRNTTQP